MYNDFTKFKTQIKLKPHNNRDLKHKTTISLIQYLSNSWRLCSELNNLSIKQHKYLSIKLNLFPPKLWTKPHSSPTLSKPTRLNEQLNSAIFYLTFKNTFQQFNSHFYVWLKVGMLILCQFYEICATFVFSL